MSSDPTLEEDDPAPLGPILSVRPIDLSAVPVDPKATHIITEMREITFKNHRGVVCTRHEYTYTRSPSLKEAIWRSRLGDYAPTVYPTSCPRWVEKPFLVFTGSPTRDVIVRAIGLKLTLTDSPHKVLYGTDLMSAYFESDATIANDLRSGYRETPLLFLRLGGETPNIHFPLVLNQLLQRRVVLALGCWVFLPETRENFCRHWSIDSTDQVLMTHYDEMRGVDF